MIFHLKNFGNARVYYELQHFSH